MKKAYWLTAVMLGAIGSVANAAPERAGDFALLDNQGDFHQLSRYRHKDAVVVFSQANNCETSESAVAQLRELRSQWADKDVAFLMMNSAGDDLASIRQTVAAQNLDFPVMLDTSQLVAQTLNISKAGEVVVLDPARLTVLYRGPVHEHIEMTLTSAKSGGVQETMIMDASGCDLNIAASSTVGESVPDYVTEVAPIIVEACADCHREGGIGPFAMNSHLMLQGWSPMIREVILTKRMPPMQIDPDVGHFSNAGFLSDADMRTVVSWIDAGAPRGSAAEDPLTQVEYVDIKAWQLGEPDYIVEMPAYEIPATGVLDYINIDVDLPFTEDKWVKAVQFVPGAPDVLHHILTYVTAPAEDFDGGESADQRSVARRFLEGYAPGKVEAMQFPADTGVYIPAGHKLSMQYHFTTNGRATVDQTRLGLYMYDEKPAHENLTRSVSGRFTIPPHAKDHEAHGTYVFENDVVVNGLRAHMHFRGKDMKFTAELPDGTMEDLLSVANYSYAWQPTYQLTEHKFLPAGTTVHVTGAFDNSAFNPANPDPDSEVTFGLQSWEEMFIGYWTYYEADK